MLWTIASVPLRLILKEDASRPDTQEMRITRKLTSHLINFRKDNATTKIPSPTFSQLKIALISINFIYVSELGFAGVIYFCFLLFLIFIFWSRHTRQNDAGSSSSLVSAILNFGFR